MYDQVGKTESTSQYKLARHLDMVKPIPKSSDLASHAGVFRGARISSLVGREEIRAPLKTPAWEASSDQAPLKLYDWSIVSTETLNRR